MSVQSERNAKLQLHGTEDELDRNRQEIEVQRRRHQAALQTLERYRKLLHDGFVSEAAVLEKEDQSATIEAQLLTMQRVRAQLQRSLEAARFEIEQIPLKTAAQTAEIDRSLASLSQEANDVQSKDTFAITAPFDGTLTAINGEIGQNVNTQTLAILIPKDAVLVAHLFPTSKAFGFVQVGQKVRMRFQPYPYQRYGQHGGTIVEASHSPLGQDEIALMPASIASSKEAVYRVIVKLDNASVQTSDRTIALLPGTALEADIEQQKKRLIEWVFDPLMSAKRLL